MARWEGKFIEVNILRVKEEALLHLSNNENQKWLVLLHVRTGGGTSSRYDSVQKERVRCGIASSCFNQHYVLLLLR